jgi:hypothetical protein
MLTSAERQTSGDKVSPAFFEAIRLTEKAQWIQKCFFFLFETLFALIKI